MKNLIILLSLGLVAGLVALGSTFTAERLPVQKDYVLTIASVYPPADMRLRVLNAGTMKSQAMFAYRGGTPGEERIFGMGGVLVQHPKGTLLFDAGFGRNVDEHFKTIPRLMQATSQYGKETPVAEQLQKAGIKLDGVVLTHAHWDHVSGLEDLPGVPVWVNQAELDFVHSGDPATALVRSFGELPYQLYDFSGGPYLGFEKSLDVFGDGSVVLVPAPGHTPGSIVAFITPPDGKRYALVGDMVWQREGVELPAERPWLSRRLVDWNEARVRGWITHMNMLQKALPNLVIVPAHDRRVWDKLPQLSE